MPTPNNFSQLIARWSGFLAGRVCYLPVLGPVYSVGHSIEKILWDILNNAASDVFLDYDKNRRWYEKKQEQINVSGIIIKKDWLCVPTISLPSGQVKFYFYAHQPLDATTLAQIVSAGDQYMREGEAKHYSVISFVRPAIDAEIRCYNIYLKLILAADRLLSRPPEIYYYNELDGESKTTFPLLGKEPDMDGFSFLAEQLAKENDFQSPIVCLVHDHEVIGAIGPLDAWSDGWGVSCLLPPYFGVKEKFRGKDCGERLWKQATSYAFEQGAQYTLVQNAPGSLAAQFYESQGLSKAGEVFVHSVK